MRTPNPYTKDNLYRKLWNFYGELHCSAYEITSHDLNCVAPTISIINEALTKWVDYELELVGESPDLTIPKNDVRSAFAVLIDKHFSRLAAEGGRCRACKMPLKTMWNDIPLACEACVVPVRMAIDQLVSCSTKMFTSEMLMERWCNVFTRPVYKF